VRPPLTLEEANAYLSAFVDTPLDAFVHLCIYLGLRRGEALGLKWDDIDFDAETLKVRRTLKEGTRFLPDGSGLTRPVCDEPKTKSSRREVQLSRPCLVALRRQRSRQRELRLAAGSAWQDSGFVFTNRLGGAIYASNVNHMYGGVIRRSGLRYVRIHDLRHTVAALMLASEVPLEAVGQVLGHSSLSVTKDIYAPWVPALTNRATAILASALEGRFDSPERRVANASALGRRPSRRAGRDPRWVGD
jgi:integrase